MHSSTEIEKIIRQLCDGLGVLFPEEKPEVILFGSCARGEAEPGSDIDVLILVDASRQTISERNWQVGDLAAELLMEYGVLVSPLVENRDYFNANAEVFPFFRNIREEGVRLVA